MGGLTKACVICRNNEVVQWLSFKCQIDIFVQDNIPVHSHTRFNPYHLDGNENILGAPFSLVELFRRSLKLQEEDSSKIDFMKWKSVMKSEWKKVYGN